MNSVEDVTSARGAPIWFQLYASPKWEVAQALIKRAESAGCPVLAVTVDRVGGRNQETLFRLMREDTRECSGCHDRTSFAKRALRRHNYDGLDLSGITGSGKSSNLSWESGTVVAAGAFAGVLAHETEKGFLVTTADAIDGDGEHWTTGQLGALDQRLGDLPLRRGIKLEPDWCSTRASDVLHRD